MPAIQDFWTQTFSVHLIKYLFIILKSVFMHQLQTTSDNQQLKDNLKELKGA